MRCAPGPAVCFLLLALAPPPSTIAQGIDHRQEMRSLVQNLAAHGRMSHPGFLVVPQNGQELLTTDGTSGGPLAVAYASTLDAVGREDLFYGYDQDDVPTPPAERDAMLAFLQRAQLASLPVLVTDYCWTPSHMLDSYLQNQSRGFLSFAAPRRDLDTVPAYPDPPWNASSRDINTLQDAANFLYLLDPGPFPTRAQYLSALRATRHDALILDAEYDGAFLTGAEVQSLQVKAGGGSRLVLAYLSVGEAEDYRFYWRAEWYQTPPPWLAEENPEWPGNYKVRYWYPGWQAILYGDPAAYLDRILAAGFDGVYLDLIDAFEYFEGQGPPPPPPITGCGDCDRSGLVTILDALRIAQGAAGILPMAPGDLGVCDADGSGSVDVLDALLVSALVAQLPVTTACP